MTMIPLADPRRATSGPCCICGAPATMWLRGTTPDGLVLAVRACNEHESDAIAARQSVTIQDYAASIPPRRRKARADAARRKARRLRGLSGVQARESAALRGASSATHTMALVSASNARKAGALEALAEALS